MVDNSTISSGDDAVAELVFGIVFVVGIIISCIPQHANCWKARSTQGLSLASLNFGTISVSCRLLATFLEDARSIATASGQLRKWVALMPTLQNVIPFFSFPTYTIYYFAWYKNSNEDELLEAEEDCSVSSTTSGDSVVSVPESLAKCDRFDRQRQDVCSTAATLLFVTAAVIASVFALFRPEQFHEDSQIRLWGGIATTTNAIMWLPQLIKTWRLQSGGVLSIIALAYAAVGDLLLGAYWVLSGETIWVWGSLVADSTMQMILIGMILYYRRCHHREESPTAYREPLLENSELADEDVQLPYSNSVL